MNKIKLVFLSILIIGLCSFTLVHKFYVSVTQVEYIESQKSLQIISRIFVDDLEDLLRERYDERIRLDKNRETPTADKYLRTYLSKKMVFEVNGQPVTFSYIGKEYEDELMICYLEIENVTTLKTIEVTNQLLLDLFDEQQNIIHVKSGNKRKSLILEAGRDVGVLKFSK